MKNPDNQIISLFCKDQDNWGPDKGLAVVTSYAIF